MVKIVAVTIVAVLIVCMLGAALLIQNDSSNNGGNSNSIQREASPFQLLDLGNRQISNVSDVSVLFHNSAGYSVNVTAISADPVEVPVPVYVDPANGTIESGVVTMETITDGVTTPIEGDLTIDTLPVVQDSPGSLTLAFIDASQSVLNATKQYLNEVKSNSTTCLVASPDLFAEINNYSANLTLSSSASWNIPAT